MEFVLFDLMVALRDSNYKINANICSRSQGKSREESVFLLARDEYECCICGPGRDGDLGLAKLWNG